MEEHWLRCSWLAGVVAVYLCPLVLQLVGGAGGSEESVQAVGSEESVQAGGSEESMFVEEAEG